MAWLAAVLSSSSSWHKTSDVSQKAEREKNESKQKQGICNATFPRVSRKVNVLYEMVENQKRKKREVSFCHFCQLNVRRGIPNKIRKTRLLHKWIFTLLEELAHPVYGDQTSVHQGMMITSKRVIYLSGKTLSCPLWANSSNPVCL